MTEPDALRRMQCLALAVEVYKVNPGSQLSILEDAENYWKWLNGTNQTETSPNAQVDGDIPF